MKRKPPPTGNLTIREIENLITDMAETADILALPEDWLADHLIATAHMHDREAARETVRAAIEFWKHDYLEEIRWKQIETRCAGRPASPAIA